MTRCFPTLLALLLVTVTLSTAYAATYSWTDEQGTVHFTENPGAVPQKFRDTALRGEEIEPLQNDLAGSPAADTPKAALTAAPSGGTAQTQSDELFAGKTFPQWEKELRDREAAMANVRTRIDEVDAKLKNPATISKALRQERHALAAKFKEMKDEYNQLVEAARKAGVEVTIEK